MSRDPVLRLATPAELGALHVRHVRRRHLAATVLDLAARGHLRVADAGDDATVGFALDRGARCPGGADALRAHERQLLTLVADTPNRLLSRVRAHADAPGVLAVLDDDGPALATRSWRG